MLVTVKVSRLDGDVYVDREVSILGVFHVDKLKKWLWNLQVYLYDLEMDIPNHPDFTYYQYEVDGDDFRRTGSFKRSWSLDEIKEVVEMYYKQKFELEINIRSHSDKQPEMRHTAMAIAKALTKQTLQKVGEMYDKDHSTVLHSTRRVSGWLETDTDYRNRVKFILSIMNEQDLIEQL